MSRSHNWNGRGDRSKSKVLNNSTSTLLTEVENSYLHETTYNSDIDDAIRKEIETKFQRSSTNQDYVFPRAQVKGNNVKLSISDVKKPIQRYKKPLSQSSRNVRKLLDKSAPAFKKANKTHNDSSRQMNSSKRDVSLLRQQQPSLRKLQGRFSDENSDIKRSNSTRKTRAKRPTVRNSPAPGFISHVRWRSDMMLHLQAKYPLNSSRKDSSTAFRSQKVESARKRSAGNSTKRASSNLQYYQKTLRSSSSKRPVKRNLTSLVDHVNPAFVYQGAFQYVRSNRALPLEKERSNSRMIGRSIVSPQTHQYEERGVSREQADENSGLQRNYQALTNVVVDLKTKLKDLEARLREEKEASTVQYSQLQKLQANHNKVCDDLDRLRNDRFNLKKQLEEQTELAREARSFKAQLEIKDTELKQLQKRFEAEKTRATQHSKRLIELQSTLAGKDKEIQAKEKEIYILREEVEVQKGVVKQLQEEVEEKKHLLSVLEKEFAAKSREYAEGQGQIHNLTKALREEQAAFENEHRICNELRMRIEGFVQDIANKDLHAMSYDLQKEKTSEIIKELQEQIANLTSTIQQLTTEGNFKIKQLKERILDQQASNDELETQIKEMQMTNEKLEFQISKLNTEIASIQKGSKTELTHKDKQLAMYLDKIQELHNQISELNTGITGKHELYNELLARTNSKDVKIQELQDKSKQKSKTIASLKAQIQNFEENIEELRGRNMELSKIISQHEGTIREMQDIYRKRSQQDKNSEFREYEAKIEGLYATIATKDRQIAQGQDEVVKAEKRVQEAEMRINQLNKTINDLKMDNGRLYTPEEYQSVNEKLQNALTDIHDLQLQLESAKADYESLLSEQANDERASLQLKNSELTKTVNANKLQLENFRKLQASQKKQIEQLEKTIEGITAQEHYVREQLRQEQDSNKDLLFQLEDIKGRLEDMEQELKRRMSQQEIDEQMSHVLKAKQVITKEVDKLVFASDSMETNISCGHCLTVIDDPIVCIPCGHMYCKSCTEGYQPNCQECGGPRGNLSWPVISELSGKIVYLKQILQGIKNVLIQTRFSQKFQTLITNTKLPTIAKITTKFKDLTSSSYA